MRRLYIDYLRSVAVVAVITIHVTVRFYSMTDRIGTPGWWLSNILNAASRFSVPLFVAISGAVLLNRTLSVADFYKKRAVRLLPPFIAWTLFYVAFRALTEPHPGILFWILTTGLFVEGRAYFHLWYLSMFLCLMAFAPFINQFVNGNRPNARELSTLLTISFVFFLVNWTAHVAQAAFHQTIYWFKAFPWFMVYFVAGHYMDRYGDEVKLGIPSIAAIAAIFTLAAAGANYYAAASLGIMEDYFILNNEGAILFVITVSIFLLARKCEDRLRENRLVSAVSDASFGIYLVHPVFISLIFNTLSRHSIGDVLYIPAAILLTALGSFAAIHLLRKISFMRALC